jgi:hypothetical protein
MKIKKLFFITSAALSISILGKVPKKVNIPSVPGQASQAELPLFMGVEDWNEVQRINQQNRPIDYSVANFLLSLS